LAPIDSQAYAEKPQILYANCRSYLKNASCDNNATWPLEVLEFILHQTKNDLLIGVAEGRVVSVEAGKQLNELEAEKTTLSAEIPRAETLYLKSGSAHHLKLIETRTARLEYVLAEIERITKSMTKFSKRKLTKEEEKNGRTVTEEEYQEREVAFEKYRDNSQKEFNAIVINESMMKSVLKVHGYTIKINGRQAYSPDSANFETFNLVKRMQKYGCYVLEVHYPENDQIRFAAIRKAGPVTWAHSEPALIAKLEEQRMDDLHV
jgi:uncharacterized protein YkuJ